MSDLFQPLSPDGKAVASPLPTEQRVRLECEFCGFKGSALVGHYDKVRCHCGRTYWALKPKLDGRLLFFSWPGERPSESDSRRQ